MGRVAEVRARAQRRTSNIYDTWFTRRVSAYITAALIPFEVSPDTVSLLNVAVGATVCGLVGFGDARGVAIGAALIHLYAVLDSVDGELARWFKRGSLRGMFLENWSAFMMIAGFPMAVALHLRAMDVGTWPLVLAIVHGTFARNAMPVARRVVLGVMQSSPAFARSEVAALRTGAPAGVPVQGARGKVRDLLEKSILYPTNVWIALSTALLVEAWVGSRATIGVTVLFAFAYAGLVVKELAILVLILRTPYLAREIERAYGDESTHRAPTVRPDAPIV